MQASGLFLAFLAITLIPAAPALAEQRHTEGPMGDKLLTPWGMSFAVGGGVSGFTNEDMRETTDVGGAWEARFALGTRSPVALEAAYTGSAQTIDALGLDTDAVLVATGLETSMRVNLMRGRWTPYALLGVGWKHYDLTNEESNTSSVRNKDDVFEVPVGAGLAYQIASVIIDARAVVRPAFGADLIAMPAGGGEAALHTWGATLRAGWEF
jgi:opacity protein-like surface antigen